MQAQSGAAALTRRTTEIIAWATGKGQGAHWPAAISSKWQRNTVRFTRNVSCLLPVAHTINEFLFRRAQVEPCSNRQHYTGGAAQRQGELVILRRDVYLLGVQKSIDLSSITTCMHYFRSPMDLRKMIYSSTISYDLILNCVVPARARKHQNLS